MGKARNLASLLGDSGTLGGSLIGETAAYNSVTQSGGGIFLGDLAHTNGNDFAIAIGADASAVNVAALAIGAYALAEMYSISLGWVAQAGGSASIAIGMEANVAADSSHGIAIGHGAIVQNGATYSIALGSYAKPQSPNAIVLNANQGLDLYGNYPGLYVKPVRSNDDAITASNPHNVSAPLNYDYLTGEIFYGGGLVAATENPPNDGSPPFDATPGKVTLGVNATADNSGAVAVGGDATGTGPYGVAVGGKASATGEGGIAMGRRAMATGVFSVAIGQYATATATGGTALGNNASAQSPSSVALGHYAMASGDETAKTIVINATGEIMAQGTTGLYVMPVRNNTFSQTAGGTLQYDTVTGEIFYRPSGSVSVGANWTVTETTGVLFFKHNGVNKAKLDSSGNFTVTGDVTAFGTV